MALIDTYFEAMLEHGASDLHLATGNAPILRISGDLEHFDMPRSRKMSCKNCSMKFARATRSQSLRPAGMWILATSCRANRFRANYFRQRMGIAAVFHPIPDKVLTADQLGLPDICRKFAHLKKGLVLVTGPTGSGKSTTLAAIIDHANKTRSDHILTVEDPIEFVHQGVKSLINHREVGTHTKSFASALKGALRENPDIILVGEMRDLETISLALEAAATGHLVLVRCIRRARPRPLTGLLTYFRPISKTRSDPRWPNP